MKSQIVLASVFTLALAGPNVPAPEVLEEHGIEWPEVHARAPVPPPEFLDEHGIEWPGVHARAPVPPPEFLDEHGIEWPGVHARAPVPPPEILEEYGIEFPTRPAPSKRLMDPPERLSQPEHLDTHSPRALPTAEQLCGSGRYIFLPLYGGPRCSPAVRARSASDDSEEIPLDKRDDIVVPASLCKPGFRPWPTLGGTQLVCTPVVENSKRARRDASSATTEQVTPRCPLTSVPVEVEDGTILCRPIRNVPFPMRRDSVPAPEVLDELDVEKRGMPIEIDDLENPNINNVQERRDLPSPSDSELFGPCGIKQTLQRRPDGTVWCRPNAGIWAKRRDVDINDLPPITGPPPVYEHLGAYRDKSPREARNVPAPEILDDLDTEKRGVRPLEAVDLDGPDGHERRRAYLIDPANLDKGTGLWDRSSTLEPIEGPEPIFEHVQRPNTHWSRSVPAPEVLDDLDIEKRGMPIEIEDPIEERGMPIEIDDPIEGPEPIFEHVQRPNTHWSRGEAAKAPVRRACRCAPPICPMELEAECKCRREHAEKCFADNLASGVVCEKQTFKCGVIA